VLLWVSLSDLHLILQSLCQAAAAVDSHESASEELCCLFETAELAMVEVVHQGNIFPFAILTVWLQFQLLGLNQSIKPTSSTLS